ncbi:carbohydrate ABC transporter permease [Neobacillus sp.]|uniref:carbohydrate ABC transporter permease n=1 Tax=Neobacillus sp. TaxID=2675273 RepID=UPI00289BA737|nr:carbohydrate ABC transporter permease [Neobacillus sp.]
MMKTKKSWNITAAVVVIAFILNIPLINTVFTSLKTEGDISAQPPKFWFTPTFEHFQNVLYAAGYDFPKFFLNSITLALSTSLLVIAISLPSAYAIVRLGFGKKQLMPFATGLRLFPPIIFAIPYYMMFQYLGLLDTVAGLVLINIFLNIPLGLLLMIGFLRDLPKDIEESAVIDGCNVFQVLFKIILPLMGPGIASVGILTFIFSWNDYLFAVIVALKNATPVTLGATMFITSWGIKWGDISAATLLSILPPLLFTFFAQRYLVKGLSAGSVKG